MKTVFMGTPEFSAVVLKYLCDAGFVPSAAVTTPDKPAGRGYGLKESSVKRFATDRNIPVLQPERLSDEGFLKDLRNIEPDIIIVVAYGKLLPETILKLPRYGCINAHASVLPKYRGAAPMQRAIMNCETETGVTIMKMEKGLDTGDIIHVLKTPITDSDTLESVHDRLAVLSGKALTEVLDMFSNGTAVFTPQNPSLATYAEKIGKEDEAIDFSEDALKIGAKIRALTPFPYAYFVFNNKKIKVTSAEPVESDFTGIPGKVTDVSKNHIDVTCGNGKLRIYEVFPESKRKMPVKDFINGNKISAGDFFK